MCVPGTERISSGKLRTSPLRHSDTPSRSRRQIPSGTGHAGVSLWSGYALPPADPGVHLIQIDAPTILIVAAHANVSRRPDASHIVIFVDPLGARRRLATAYGKPWQKQMGCDSADRTER